VQNKKQEKMTDTVLPPSELK